MKKLATVYGGSGFVGRYIVERLAHEGWRVRVAVRRPNEALFLKTYGDVGQVEPVLCNIRDEESVRAAMTGAQVVINCVGILAEYGKNRFEAVQHEGAERIARSAAALGVQKLVHLSSIGADVHGQSEYARSKGEGEKAVLSHFPEAVILRPSVIFGTEDEFFNRFAKMMKFGPVLPIVGGRSRMQPVWVEDVALAAIKAALGHVAPGIYELGGPDVYSLRELIGIMLGVVERRRLVINLPFWVGGAMGLGLDLAQKVSLGLFRNTILTRDQVRSLRNDNVVGAGASGFAELGIKPAALEAVLPEYLWVYRPSGQYAAIKDSAKNLKLEAARSGS